MGIFLNKCCVGLGFMIIYLYSIEVYPTNCRVTGNGLTLASGRVGSMSGGRKIDKMLLYEKFRIACEIFL